MKVIIDLGTDFGGSMTAVTQIASDDLNAANPPSAHPIVNPHLTTLTRMLARRSTWFERAVLTTMRVRARVCWLARNPSLTGHPELISPYAVPVEASNNNTITVPSHSFTIVEFST